MHNATGRRAVRRETVGRGVTQLRGLDRVWEHLLPALSGPGRSSAADEEELAVRLGALRLPPPVRAVPAPTDLRGRTVVHETPAGSGEVAVTGTSPEGAITELELRSAAGVRRLAVGDGTWAEGALPWEGRDHPVRVAGAWTEPDLHELHVRWVETPSAAVLRSRVDGAEVRTSTRFTVRFDGPKELGEVVGRLR